MERLRRGSVLGRIALAGLTILVVWGATKGWGPEMPYRVGDIPPRGLLTRVAFSVPDPKATADQQLLARRTVQCVYLNRSAPVTETRSRLCTIVPELVHAGQFEQLSEGQLAAWREFWPAEADPTVDDGQLQQAFALLVGSLPDDEALAKFEGAMQRALAPIEEDGLLEELHSPELGSQTTIQVHLGSDQALPRPVAVDDVVWGKALASLRGRLEEELSSVVADVDTRALLLERIDTWLRAQLSPTLELDEDATEVARQRRADAVPEQTIDFEPGEKFPGIVGGEPLDEDAIALLDVEHEALLETRTFTSSLARSVASLLLAGAMFFLSGYFAYVRSPELLRDFRKYGTLLLTITIAIGCSFWAALWRAELIPLMLFAFTGVIVYGRQLTLLFSLTVAVIAFFALGLGMVELTVALASLATIVMTVGRIRSRTKLMYVGLAAGGITLMAHLAASVLFGVPLGWTSLSIATWYGFCGVLTGLLMTGLLPFVESLYDVQTDISLLELGDAAHPLLQELVRRAPGTYNHSINVASIGEAAAEAIGANGLLVRVGAYFHDIGKMLKPNYFAENQGHDGSRHEQLMPTMSTLVIIAHVKDGADLARQHRLPQRMIDFILQHHGTTLVEFFYDRASKQSEQDPEAGEVDEGSYRYPGPKPQSKETGVIMLADAVESATRTLTDPAPARIEGLVHELLMKRLLDGQFDQCGLTLRELAVIEDSLIKSLTAVYHSRVKYPDQQTA